MALGPLPDVAGVLRVKFSGTNQGMPWVALFFWHYNAPALNTGDVNSVLTQFRTAYSTHLAGAMAATVIMDSAEGWDLSSRAGAVGAVSGGIPGTRSGGSLPVSVAAVASWKVNFRWRGGHPRTYWPAGVVADITGGHLWTSSAANAFDTANGAFLAAVNGITVGGVGGHLSCVRYFHTIHELDGTKHVEYFDPPLDLPIIDVSVDQRVDTQRRRLGPDL